MPEKPYAPISKYCAECQPKPANKYLRWNLLFAIIIATLLTSPVWMALIPVLRRASMEFIIAVLAAIQFMWFMATVNAIRYVLKLRREFVCNDCLKNERDLESTGKSTDQIKHLIGLTLYKEPLELLIRTTDSLARQTKAKKSLSVFIGLEEGTPDKENKIVQLRERYKSQFERFIITVHPRDLCGDIAGKCSNLNYAARKAIDFLSADPEYGLSDGRVELLVTTGDCDSIFPPKYFDCLEKDYIWLNEEDRHRTVWQSPLFYSM
uniref:Glycosyltransferase 2-like domain-containing protein n=1 Tax=Plectus sambesii TaxID=2011161 RepID=A0A914XFQ4_9BILA